MNEPPVTLEELAEQSEQTAREQVEFLETLLAGADTALVREAIEDMIARTKRAGRIE